MRRFERPLLADVVPGAAADLLVFAKTALQSCILRDALD